MGKSVKTIVIVVATIFGLIFLGSVTRPMRSEMQKKYDDWLKEESVALESSMRQATPSEFPVAADNGTAVPQLSISATIKTDDNQDIYTFSSASPLTPSLVEKLERILEIFKVANLFSIASSTTLENDSATFSVQTANTQFTASMPLFRIKESAQLSLAVNLLKEFSANATALAAVPTPETQPIMIPDPTPTSETPADPTPTVSN